MRGVTSFLTLLCLDSLPGPALPGPSRVCLTVQGSSFLSCTLSLQARCQLLLVAIPLPLLAVEGYGGWHWQAVGLSQDSPAHCLPCSPKVLDLHSCPIPCPVPSLSPSSQNRRSEPGAAPCPMEAAGSHGDLGDGIAVNMLSSHLGIWFGNGKIPHIPTVCAWPVISLSALSCFCLALWHRHFCSTGSSSATAMLRDALSLQVDPDPICSLSANIKKAQPIHPAWMEETLEVKKLRSVLRCRMIPAAFPHPHAAMHRTKLSSPDPGESCSLLGVPLQGTEMRHLLGFLFGQMLWEVFNR